MEGARQPQTTKWESLLVKKKKKKEGGESKMRRVQKEGGRQMANPLALHVHLLRLNQLNNDVTLRKQVHSQSHVVVVL